jgi:hypothetical protein
MKTSIASLLTLLSLVGVATTPVSAQESSFNSPQFACSSANDATYIRDYPTFKPVAKLDRGECMAIVPDYNKGTPVKLVFRRGETFYVVTGASGNVRVVSARYTVLK